MSGQRSTPFQSTSVLGNATRVVNNCQHFTSDIPPHSSKTSATPDETGKWLDVLNIILTSFKNAEDKGNGIYLHLENVDLKAFAEEWSRTRQGHASYVSTHIKPQYHTGGREDWVLVGKTKIDTMIDEISSLNKTVETQRSQLKEWHPVEQTQRSHGAIMREKTDKPIQRARPKSSYPKQQQYIEQLEKDREDKQRLIDENKLMETKIETLTRNISSMMNQAMCRDESDLENINIKNRPMKILGEYELICSEDWLDAKRAVDKYAPGMDEYRKLAKLNNIFMVCYQTATRMFENQQKALMKVLQHPVKVTRRPNDIIIQPKQVPSKTESPVEKGLWTTDLDVAVSKYLKLNCETVDYNDMAEDILSSNFEEGEWRRARTSQRIDYFIKAVCQLSWKMVIQKPAMGFEASDLNKSFREEKHELHWGSSNKKEAIIINFVYPALYHGDKIVKKAKVVLGLPSDATKI